MVGSAKLDGYTSFDRSKTVLEERKLAVAGMMWRALLACATLLVGWLPVIAEEAQETEASTGEPVPQSLFFDSVDIDVVNLEVMVTDPKGQPITGLTQDDFEIFEDGREVDVTYFDEVLDLAEGLPSETRLSTIEVPASDSAVSESAASESATSDSTTTESPTPEAADAKPVDGPRVIILVDNLNISPQSRKLLFTQLRKHLEERVLSTGLTRREVMVATLDRKLEIALPFTNDRQQLLEALGGIERGGSSHAVLDADRRMFLTRLQRASLRSFQPRQSVVQGNRAESVSDPDFDDAIRVALDLALTVRGLGEQRYRKVKTTLEMLGELCSALGGMAGRKALIYLSDGLPLRPADSLTEAWTGKYENWVLQNSAAIRTNSFYPDAGQAFQQVMNSLASSEFDLHQELRRLTEHASAQRVVFYPISVYGRSPEHLSAAVSGGGISAGSGSMLRRADALESATRDASLLQMAEETGGLAWTRSANLGGLFERVDRDLASYYALGYYPPLPIEELEAEADPNSEAGTQAASGDQEITQEPDEDLAIEVRRPAANGSEKLRRLKVKVKHRGAKVRHGIGYASQGWRQRLGSMTLASALFEQQHNPLGVELEPREVIREGDRFRMSVLLTVPFDQIRMVYHEDQYIAQLTAVVVVRNEGDGGLSEPHRVDFPIQISGRRILEVVQQLAGYVLELEMDRGPKRIAVGVRDHFARTEATVHLGIMVGEGAS